jgi:hypothetical protein
MTPDRKENRRGSAHPFAQVCACRVSPRANFLLNVVRSYTFFYITNLTTIDRLSLCPPLCHKSA